MSSVDKPQRAFMMALFSVLMIFQGRATFRNMSRYSGMSEKRFSRWYRKSFDFCYFNCQLLHQTGQADAERIAAIDASFISKSGKQTEGLDKFYNDSAGEAQRGLEISMISVVNLTSNTAYTLEARQTIDEEARSRVDLYAKHASDRVPYLKQLPCVKNWTWSISQVMHTIAKENS